MCFPGIAKDILIIELLLLGGAYQCIAELARKFKKMADHLDRYKT